MPDYKLEESINIAKETKEDREVKTHRRKIIALAALATAGLAATSLTGKARAVDQPLLIGTMNFGGGQKTMLQAEVDSAPIPDLPSAFGVLNDGEIIETPPTHHPPVGILGMCPRGMGVSGLSETDTGVHGRSTSGVGVVGKSVTGTGVQAVAERLEDGTQPGTALGVNGVSRCYAKVNTFPFPDSPFDLPSALSVYNDAIHIAEKPPFAIVGHCPHGTGIAGFSDDNAAVHGNSMNNVGVDGYSQNNVGVRGWTIEGEVGVEGRSNTGIGVLAKSESGTALKVEGRGIVNASVKWPEHALEVHNDADPIEGEGWIWPISIVGICEKGVGLSGYGTHQGVHGKTDGGTGVHGGSDNGIGVVGESNIGEGVVGRSTEGTGVKAESPDGVALGVDGKSRFFANVGPVDPHEERGALNVLNSSEDVDPRICAILGNAPNGVGIDGRGKTGVHGCGEECGVAGKSEGTGLFGYSQSGIGARAESTEGVALRVEGISSFKTVGNGFIEPNKFSVDVSNSLVTDNSHISFTLTGNPDKVSTVWWIQRRSGEGFTAYLTDKVKRSTPFTYFIVEP